MNNVLIYILFVLGIGTTLGGAIRDLIRDHHNLKSAEREAGRYGRIEKEK